MTEKTVREMINKAIGLYDKGEWNKSLELLEIAFQAYLVDNKTAAEIHMMVGWNYWKRGDKDLAASSWMTAMEIVAQEKDNITKASAHAGLGIYYAEKGNKEKALHHAKLAQELLPLDATINQVMNLNACGISLAKIGELKLAEEVLRKVAKINEQLEKSDDPATAKKAEHQRAKNGYNLASLILIPQGRFYEASMELDEEVIPRYVAVEAETDLAAAYHRIAEINEKLVDEGGSHNTVKSAALDLALQAEEKSLALWQKHPDDPKRVKTAKENVARIKEKFEKLKQ